MEEWLLSGHNTLESFTLARPLTASAGVATLNRSVSWFMHALYDGIFTVDDSLPPSVAVQGWIYLNINYSLKTAFTSFDPESLGVSQRFLEQHPELLALRPKPATPGQTLRVLARIRRLYQQAKAFYQQELAQYERDLKALLERMKTDNTLVPVWELLSPEQAAKPARVGQAHETVSIILIILGGLIKEKAPELSELFAGNHTTTSQLGMRLWELRTLALQSGPEVVAALKRGETDIAFYRHLPQAAQLVAGVERFLQDYGHRGFRYELDFASDRLMDHPEMIWLAIAAQLDSTISPEERARAAREEALKALNAMPVLQRRFWQALLAWGQELIAYREDSKSFMSLQQAVYRRALELCAQHYHPDYPQDVMLFYTMEELDEFIKSRGEKRLSPALLERRLEEYKLYSIQKAPPELIWYNPGTRLWRPALEEEQKKLELEVIRQFQGIPASVGNGVVEGMALVTNDPIEAGRLMLNMSGPIVLVTRLTDPAWSSIFARLSAVVTELGGVVSHAAIVARENGLPAVVGVADVTRHIRNGQRLRVDGRTGLIEVLD